MEITEDKIKGLIKANFKSLVEENKEFFFELFKEFIIEAIEDKGMLNALKEISQEGCEESDADEMDAIFNGDFINQE